MSLRIEQISPDGIFCLNFPFFSLYSEKRLAARSVGFEQVLSVALCDYLSLLRLLTLMLFFCINLQPAAECALTYIFCMDPSLPSCRAHSREFCHHLNLSLRGSCCGLAPPPCCRVPQWSRKGKYPQGNMAAVSSEQKCSSHLLKSSPLRENAAACPLPRVLNPQRLKHMEVDNSGIKGRFHGEELCGVSQRDGTKFLERLEKLTFLCFISVTHLRVWPCEWCLCVTTTTTTTMIMIMKFL